MHHRTNGGWAFRTLNVMGESTRESLATLPVYVNFVEEFHGLFGRFQRAEEVPVCPSRFTQTAKVRAEGLGIDLYSPVDTHPHK